MSHRRYILPIFLLYIITSFVFLLVFSISYYTEAKNEIYTKAYHELRSYVRNMQQLLRLRGDITDILEPSGEYELNVFDMKTQRYIVKNFDTPKKFDYHYAKDDEFVYVVDRIHSQRRIVDLRLELRSVVPKDSIASLLTKVLAINAVVFGFICLIAYFIIKLSYRPFLRQIQIQNDFITDTTHEINTPLSVILMSIEVFHTNPQKYLNNIKIAATSLSNLYSDLAINLKSEKNKLEILNLKEIFLQRVSFFELSAANKGLKFVLNLKECELKSDSFKLKKIIDNIISNAIKYSFANKEIIVNLNEGGFSIANVGQGISKENLGKIYEKFTRFDSQNGGFGIGLSLVKRYCDELGFTLSCVSEKDKTEFSVGFKRD